MLLNSINNCSIKLWLIAEEWEILWNDWKLAKFASLDTSDMEAASQLISKRLTKLIREIKVSNVINWLVTQPSLLINHCILSYHPHFMISVTKV